MATVTRKIGAYICSGCRIGDAVDVDKLKGVAEGEMKADICRVHECLCSEEGVALVNQDIADEGVTAAVICACSMRVNTDVFSFDDSVFLERVNLREQVAWVQPAGHEDTQMMAEDYTRMGLTRAQRALPPEPHIEEMNKTILVVGGGLAGLTAAAEAAEAGYQVVLVEIEAELGGWVARQHKLYPSAAPYRELEDVSIGRLIDKVNADDRITVHTAAVIRHITGAPGMFDVAIDADGQTVETQVGAVIQANGAEAYDAAKLETLGYGLSADVVTTDQFEAMAAAGEIIRPSDGAPAKAVAFILCAGSRDPEHLSYCSATCCLKSVKQALHLRERDPEAKAYVVYKDMRTPGHYEDFYRRVQEDPGIFLTKGEVAGVEQTNGQVTVAVRDSLLGESIALKADLVVLATGMTPRAGIERDRKAEVAGETADGKADAKQSEEAKPQDRLGLAGGEPVTTEGSVLNLQYRQGPDLPQLKYGFPDSHFICFPYETRRTGIYAAGVVRQPMGEIETVRDARGAAMKAIQAVEMTGRGEKVHPRAGDISFPDFALKRCTQCKRCTEECPFGTLNEDVKGTPEVNLTRCRSCGICLGACPERIISFKNYSPDIIGTMIKSVEMPDEVDEKPRILVFACENDAYPALDMLGLRARQYSPFVRVIPVRCLGSVNLVWIADALSRGFDAIVLIGCKYGDDYQCHFIHGSELANTRMSNIQETLERLMLESERVQVHQVAINEWERVHEILEAAAETVEQVGYNPYKSM